MFLSNFELPKKANNFLVFPVLSQFFLRIRSAITPDKIAVMKFPTYGMEDRKPS